MGLGTFREVRPRPKNENTIMLGFWVINALFASNFQVPTLGRQMKIQDSVESSFNSRVISPQQLCWPYFRRPTNWESTQVSLLLP